MDVTISSADARIRPATTEEVDTVLTAAKSGDAFAWRERVGVSGANYTALVGAYTGEGYTVLDGEFGWSARYGRYGDRDEKYTDTVVFGRAFTLPRQSPSGYVERNILSVGQLPDTLALPEPRRIEREIVADLPYTPRASGTAWSDPTPILDMIEQLRWETMWVRRPSHRFILVSLKTKRRFHTAMLYEAGKGIAARIDDWGVADYDEQLPAVDYELPPEKRAMLRNGRKTPVILAAVGQSAGSAKVEGPSVRRLVGMPADIGWY